MITHIIACILLISKATLAISVTCVSAFSLVMDVARWVRQDGVWQDNEEDHTCQHFSPSCKYLEKAVCRLAILLGSGPRYENSSKL